MQPRNDREELDRFKAEIDLVAFAQSCGYVVDHKESSPRGNPTNWILRRPTDDSKLLVRRGDQAWVFVDLRGNDRGTIIDFLRRERRLSLGEIRKELRHYTGARLPAPTAAPVTPAAPALDRRGIGETFLRAHKGESAYLRYRGLSDRTLQDPRFAGTWRQDARGTILFPHLDEEGITGFELKNHGFTGFTPGGRKALWRSCQHPKDQRLVIAESAIDALSYHEAHGDQLTRYVSVAGHIGRDQKPLLRRAIDDMGRGSRIVMAVDRDAGGDRLEHLIRELGGGADLTRHSPPAGQGKDWNDFIRRRAQELDR